MQGLTAQITYIASTDPPDFVINNDEFLYLIGWILYFMEHKVAVITQYLPWAWFLDRSFYPASQASDGTALPHLQGPCMRDLFWLEAGEKSSYVTVKEYIWDGSLRNLNI